METGIFRITVDEKGRFMVPKKMRSSFVSKKFILTYGVDKCLQLLTLDEFDRLKKAIHSKVGTSFNTHSRLLLRRYVAPATEIDIDSNGRITIPRALREDIGIIVKRESIFISAGNFMEIWNEDNYNAMQEASFNDLEVASQEVFEIMNEGE